MPGSIRVPAKKKTTRNPVNTINREKFPYLLNGRKALYSEEAEVGVHVLLLARVGRVPPHRPQVRVLLQGCAQQLLRHRNQLQPVP